MLKISRLYARTRASLEIKIPRAHARGIFVSFVCACSRLFVLYNHGLTAVVFVRNKKVPTLIGTAHVSYTRRANWILIDKFSETLKITVAMNWFLIDELRFVSLNTYNRFLA
ncbi:MAG: hypothetical protein HYT34_00515 [Candidatus Ryanbacteria bacterium]|nr:hypothetical protein [Candidatus Ryanbacteria bacterium]